MRYDRIYKVRAEIGGRVYSFDSLEECYFAGWLELMRLNGEIRAWYREGQRVENGFKSVWIDFGKLGTKNVKGTYCDFLVILNDGRRQWWEFKGRMFPKDRVKVNRLVEIFGDDFRLVRQGDDWWQRNRILFFKKINQLIRITSKIKSYETSKSSSRKRPFSKIAKNNNASRTGGCGNEYSNLFLF